MATKKRILLTGIILGLLVATLALAIVYIIPIAMLSYGLAEQRADAHEGITSYINTLDEREIAELLVYSQELMQSASDKEIPVKRSLFGETLPQKWAEYNVNYIYFNESLVDFSFSGGINGRIALTVRRDRNRLTIEAVIEPDGPMQVIYPIDKSPKK